MEEYSVTKLGQLTLLCYVPEAFDLEGVYCCNHIETKCIKAAFVLKYFPPMTKYVDYPEG